MDFTSLVPNIEQVKSALRWLISSFGMVFAGWFAAKGYFSVDQVLSIFNNETLIGLAASGIVFVFGLITHKQSNAVAVVAKIAEDPSSPVKAVVVEPTVAGRALATSIDSTKVVPAGTAAATAAAAHPVSGENL